MPVGVLPSAPEAEASLLGTMMVYPNAARTGMEEGLSEDDFFVDVNRRIFTAVSSLYHEGSPVDLTTVSTRLKDMGQLELVGGFAYLTSLTDAAVTSHNTKHYVAMIHDKALLRKLIETAQTIVEEGTSGQADINEYLDQSEKAILNVSRSRRVSEFKGSPELMTSVLDQIQKMSDNHSDITGLKTGFRDLDHVTHGLQRGDLIILAARPSMGKTAVALNLALNVALYQPKQAVAIFSLEMAAEQLAMRLLSARSRVAGDKLKTGYLTNEEWNRVNEAAGELKMLKLYVDDTPGVKTSDIFSKCRRVNRQQEVSEISRNLKALARELGIPVIALSQLSRTVEQRENKHPQLSDLRESGAIEQDADIVMMLYRESYYNQEMKDNLDPDASEPLEINIAKHRNGATRRINVAFEASTNALMNIELTKEP